MGIVGSALMERAWESKARENYAAIVGDVAPKSFEEVIRGLEAHIEKTVPPTKHVQCDVCGGWSSEDYESCPYCADQGPTELSGESEPSLVAASPVPDAPESKVDSVAEGTEIDARAIEESGVSLKEEKPKKKTGTTKVSAEEKQPKKAPPAPKPSAPALDIAEAKPQVNEKDLDEALKDYRDAGQRNAASFWHMGVAISKIHDRLWQQRSAEGKPKYKSFSQFVDSELDITLAYANRLRGLSVNFTEKTAEQYGPKILMIVARAPKEYHQELLQKVDRDQLTTRQLEEEVAGIREEKGIKVIESEATKNAASKGKNVPSKAATEAAATLRKKKSAAIAVGLKRIEGDVVMFAKPEKPGTDKKREAKALDDAPYGMIEGINGVNLYLSIKTNSKGFIEIHYLARREDDGEE